MSISNVDSRGRFDEGAGDEVGEGEVGEEHVIGGGRHVRQVLESDQHQVVGERPQDCEHHLRHDQAPGHQDLSVHHQLRRVVHDH